MKKILLNGEALKWQDVIAISYHDAFTEIDTAKLQQSRDYIVQKVNENKIIYGVTTGFGSNTDKYIAADKTEILQLNLLRSHACGVGAPLSRAITRAAMAIRLNTLLKGHSGVQESTVRQLQFLLNNKIHPIIPEQGSVGASGDLCPLAHMALPLIGEGELEYDGQRYDTETFLKTEMSVHIGFKPVTLSYKEGLALTNGTTIICAAGVVALHLAVQILESATLSSALLFEAIGARKNAFAFEKIHLARRHSGQIAIANQLTQLLSDSTFINISQQHIIKHVLASDAIKSEIGSTEMITVLEQLAAETDVQKQQQIPDQLIYALRATGKSALADLFLFAKKKWKPQDAYSIRCVPQVFGATKAAIDHVEEILNNELNAAGDNPLIFAEEDAVISGGNFHGQPVALIMDYLKLAIAEIGNICERQINKLVDASTNDVLPPFLIEGSGLNNGMMIPQYVAASLVSENKVLVHPASADSVPTCENTEDHVSMGTIAARQAIQICGNVERIISIALLTGFYAFRLREKQLLQFELKLHQSSSTQKLMNLLQKIDPELNASDFLKTDRYLSKEINAVNNNFGSIAKLASDLLH
ncbi:MAG: aromatic amino acid lyase [Chitinophagales bacterium]